uniref:Transmembrane protein n=2 Tax=Neospora caninum (strain Liverpool) TaxID=572307 RepID=A0A0F7UIH4_NEOCL|nr:TPA: hypothetical protein BN1204_045780 [Neospora caninum Liverpool]
MLGAPECGVSPPWSHSISCRDTSSGDASCEDVSAGDRTEELQCYYIDVAFDSVPLSEANTSSTEAKMLSKWWGDESVSPPEADGKVDSQVSKQKPSSESGPQRRRGRVARAARRLYVQLPRVIRRPRTRSQEKTGGKRVPAYSPSLTKTESVLTVGRVGEGSCRSVSSVDGALSASGGSMKRACSRGRSHQARKCSCESVFGVYAWRVILAACIMLLALLVQLVLLCLGGNMPFAYQSAGPVAAVTEQGKAQVGQSAGSLRAAKAHTLPGEDPADLESLTEMRGPGFCETEPVVLNSTSSHLNVAGPVPGHIFLFNVVYLVYVFCFVLRMCFLTPNLASAVTIRFFLCVSVAFLFRGLSCLVCSVAGPSMGSNRPGLLGGHAVHVVLEAAGLWTFGDDDGVSPVSSQRLILWILVSFWGYYTSKHVFLAYAVVPIVAAVVCLVSSPSTNQFAGHAAATLFISCVCIIYHLLVDIAAQRYLRTQSFGPSAGSIAAFCERYVVGDALIQVLALLEALHLRLEGALCVSSPSVVAHIKLPEQAADEDPVSAQQLASHSLTYEDLASRVVLAYAGSGDFDATNCRQFFQGVVKKVRAFRKLVRCREAGDEAPAATECEMEVFAAPQARRANVSASPEFGA